MSSPPATVRRISAILPTARQALIVTVFSLLLSWLLHLLSGTAYPAVFGRIGFLGAALLLAYSAAGALRPRYLSLSTARLAAVVLTAPLASLFLLLVTRPSQYSTPMAKTADIIGHVIMVVLAIIFGLLFSLLAMRSERRERERADRLQTELTRNTLERQLLDARLRLLQAQIEPHFLFNTLANVEALVASGSPDAGPVLRQLIAYLRAAMPRLNDEAATLEQELQLVRAYLELMQMRMPDRLQFDVATVPQAASVRFPPMALLTLVENAVRHGIDPGVDGGRIDVGAALDTAGGLARVWVGDTGAGMADTAQPGTGLNNVRSRLLAVYGPGARLELHAVAPHGVRAELHFPLSGDIA